MSRQEANLQILDLLYKAVQQFPDQRFGQLLRNLDIITEIRDSDGIVVGMQSCFNDESATTLSQMDNSAIGKYLLRLAIGLEKIK